MLRHKRAEEQVGGSNGNLPACRPRAGASWRSVPPLKGFKGRGMRKRRLHLYHARRHFVEVGALGRHKRPEKGIVRQRGRRQPWIIVFLRMRRQLLSLVCAREGAPDQGEGRGGRQRGNRQRGERRRGGGGEKERASKRVARADARTCRGIAGLIPVCGIS